MFVEVLAGEIIVLHGASVASAEIWLHRLI